MLFTNLGCLYGLCYIMLWILDFGFIDFYTFIMVTVELGVYIIRLYYAIYLFLLFFIVLL